ncbi:hypothetical protein GGI12_000745 [Dipsacomyces acuminosporus]|nr:hypothetical protein GGI12_000745 [Dipsacomyces acuminosporus]
MTQEYSISISHKGKAADFALTADTTVAELRQMVSQQFGIEPANQRLLPRSGAGANKLADDNEVVSNVIPHGTKVLLMGTASKELSSLSQSTAKRELGRQNYEKFKASANDVYSTSRQKIGTLGSDPDSEYTFHGFETLPNLPHRDKAMGILRKLAKDEGVRQIMKKRQYSVGILRELHPFERTILGYNRNKGQVIALRLRTDDLDGFRDYLNIRQVLMHELAHMIWSEHDESFHKLNREHCKEVVELDWTLRGKRLAGENAVFYEPESSSDQIDGGSLTEAGFVLGGKAPEMPAGDDDQDPAQARRGLILKALEKRSSK